MALLAQLALSLTFDGKDELLLNYYHSGPKGCSMAEIYEITDTAFVPKYPVGSDDHFYIDENTIIDSDTKTFTEVNKNSLYCEDWTTSCYQADSVGELHLIYSTSHHLTKQRILLFAIRFSITKKVTYGGQHIILNNHIPFNYLLKP